MANNILTIFLLTFARGLILEKLSQAPKAWCFSKKNFRCRERRQAITTGAIELPVLQNQTPSAFTSFGIYRIIAAIIFWFLI